MEGLKSVLVHELNLSSDLQNIAFGPSPFKNCQFGINEVECIKTHREQFKRSATTPAKDMSGPAVMYLPLGGAAPPGCPSIAESAVTGISQMVFIWTIMSVFAAVSNVVANINNNQNNNNNNDNNINLNIVSTQNTQISSNVNNANTISIMLPPPIPVLAGGRKLEAERRLKRFLAREERLRRKRELNISETMEVKDQVSLIAIDILKYLFEPPNQRFAQSLEQQDCLGRRLCQMSKKSQQKFSSTKSILESTLLKLTSFALLYIELEDHTQTFIHFIEALADENVDSIDCEKIFWKCTTDDVYF